MSNRGEWLPILPSRELKHKNAGQKEREKNTYVEREAASVAEW